MHIYDLTFKNSIALVSSLSASSILLAFLLVFSLWQLPSLPPRLFPTPIAICPLLSTAAAAPYCSVILLANSLQLSTSLSYREFPNSVCLCNAFLPWGSSPDKHYRLRWSPFSQRGIMSPAELSMYHLRNFVMLC